MLTEMPTPEMIKEWKIVSEKYKPLLKPNTKTASQVIDYLHKKYPLEEVATDSAKQVVIDNITFNKPFADKLPEGKTLKPIVFSIPNRDGAVPLYERQEEVFKNITIMVGLEFETAYVGVEGSGELADELVAFQGLDEADLDNFFLVANYVICLKKYGLLDEVLKQG